MNTLKICKDLEQLNSVKISLITENPSSVELDDKTLKIGSSIVYLCTPCFVDADRLHAIAFNKIEILFEEINEWDGKWIAEIYGYYVGFEETE